MSNRKDENHVEQSQEDAERNDKDADAWAEKSSGDTGGYSQEEIHRMNERNN